MLPKNKLLVFSFFFICHLLLADQKADQEIESLRKKIFSPHENSRVCRQLSRGQNANELEKIDKPLGQTIYSILDFLKSKNEDGLLKLFHPKLKVTKPKVAEIFATLSLKLGKSWQASLYRVWALNSYDGDPDPILCKDDGLRLGAHAIFKLQMGLWFEIVGNNQLSRVFVSLIPIDGRWFIGTWHYQQWSHGGKDPEKWIEKAHELAKAGNKVGAYVYLNIAEKIYNAGGGYLFFDRPQELVALKATVLSEQLYYETIKGLIKDQEVLNVGTLLATDGAGILVRLRVKDINVAHVELKKMCMTIGKTIYQQPWSSVLGGIKCSYVLPEENPKVDGKLGGQFFSRKMIVETKI